MTKSDLSTEVPARRDEGGRADPPSPKAMAGKDDESNPKSDPPSSRRAGGFRLRQGYGGPAFAGGFHRRPAGFGGQVGVASKMADGRARG